jgi:TRAP-type C4-dicarboxylate transport system permease small subunit
MSSYNYGVPGIIIWIFHILFGSFLIFVGWQISRAKQTAESESKKPQYVSSLPPWIGLILLILGSLALFYHLHLMLFAGSFKICPFAKTSFK